MDDDGLAISARAPDDSAQPRDQLGAVERLGEVVISAGDEAAHFIGDFIFARKDQHRRLHAGKPQPPQHVIAVNVGQFEVKDDDVVIVEFAELKAFFAGLSGVGCPSFINQQALDAA